jgi:hypothetical protein
MLQPWNTLIPLVLKDILILWKWNRVWNTRIVCIIILIKLVTLNVLGIATQGPLSNLKWYMHGFKSQNWFSIEVTSSQDKTNTLALSNASFITCMMMELKISNIPQPTLSH